MYKNLAALSILFFLFSAGVHADTNSSDTVVEFDDSMLEEELVYPDWFKLSLGNLGNDLKEAKKAGKKGIITYFGQKRCAYCEQFFKTSLADTDIKNYLQRHYDLIAFDIWGIDDIVDTDGKEYTERELSVHYKANFTPSLVFYDADGKPVFRLRGYYPPYKFRAALQYVVEEFYKTETFSAYFERATPGEYFLLGGLTERDFFLEEPYDLASLRGNGKPTAVFFEQGNCHACDLLHSGPLSKDLSIQEIEKMNAIQLNMWADTPVVTPQGKKTTAREWARSLDIFYAPSIVFFDEDGKEIIRVDSVAQFYRLWGVMDYVNQQGYKYSTDYQEWRLKQRKVSK
ncbi:MAG: thioredoxin fold domain-containing protein [Gammaproteobacteria bacterium]|nr:thioredoxin fold domain-containing protein [Gammaproteobacteria bacterium]